MKLFTLFALALAGSVECSQPERAESDITLCASKDCGEWKKCEVRRGDAVCTIPKNKPCKGLKWDKSHLCESGTLCDESHDGTPVCREPAQCEKCPKKFFCRNTCPGKDPKCEKKGRIGDRCAKWAKGLGCKKKLCKSYLQCIDGECQKKSKTCADSPCGPNEKCHMFNGQPKCVPVHGPCDTKQCGPNQTCKMFNGQPKCIIIDSPCNPSPCGPNELCHVLNNKAECILFPGCDLTETHCKPGHVSKCVDGIPKCVPIEPPSTCADFPCNPNDTCKMFNGKPTCDHVDTLCDMHPCGPNEICRVLNGKRMCMNLGCGDLTETQCFPGQDLICDDGIPKCVPSKPTCDSVCDECRIINGKPACLIIDKICDMQPCGPNEKCHVLNGERVCSVIAGCDLTETQCLPGHDLICVDGNPKCVPSKPTMTCANVRCKKGFECSMIKDVPKCVATE